MHIRLCALVIFWTASYSLFAMEEPASTLTEPQQAILIAIANYKEHLADSLGCGLRGFIEEKFETDHYLHVRDRYVQLHELTNLVKSDEWHDKVSRMLTTMGEFRRHQGKLFRWACDAALKRASPIDNSEENCIKCWEGKRFVLAKPCNHLLYCDCCAEGLRESKTLPGKCALCRGDADYQSLHEISDTCLACEAVSDALAPTCGHVVLCMACAESKTQCPICQKVCKQFEQVYR